MSPSGSPGVLGLQQIKQATRGVMGQKMAMNLARNF